MADYSIADLSAAASRAGFSGAALVTAVAVSLAENGSRSLRAVNVNRDGSRDRGPWQINDKAHPDVSDGCAFDLACSAQAAFRISSSGRKWTPWTAFTSGAYKQHLQDAAGSSSDASGADPASALSSAVGAVTGSWLSAGQVAAGAVIVLVAVVAAVATWRRA